MHTLQPALKRGRDVWDPISMPAQEFQDRVARIRDIMAKRDIDLCLLYGRGSNHYGNSTYISGTVIVMPRGAMAVVPRDREVVLIAEGFPRDLPALKRTSWIADVRPCPNIALEFGKYLGEMKEPPRRVCLVGPKALMPYQQYRQLKSDLCSLETIEDDGFVAGLRMIKSEKEYDQIRRASRVARSAFDFVSETPLKTMSETYVEATLDYFCRLEGAEDVRILVGRPNNEYWSLRPAEAADIHDGDRLAVYLAVEYERYWAECVRTLQVESSRLKAALSDETAGLLGRIAKQIRPQVPIRDFMAAAKREIEASQAVLSPWNELGRGIGLSLHEYPYLDSQLTESFQNGMCFALNLAAGHPSRGGFMVGDTIGLNQGQCDILTAG